MQILRTCFFTAAFLCASQQAVGSEQESDAHAGHQHHEMESSTAQAEYGMTEVEDSSTATDILSEIVIRPAAILGSATGFTLFVIASPFSGLASIPEPHDAFQTTWNDFVVTPYHFAFRRPLGAYSAEIN